MSKFMRHFWIIRNFIVGYFINVEKPRHPKYLIGKWALRIKPAQCSYGNDGSYSHCRDIVKILKVTENHIYCLPVGSNKDWILDKNWIDENWVEYKPVKKIV